MGHSKPPLAALAALLALALVGLRYFSGLFPDQQVPSADHKRVRLYKNGYSTGGVAVELRATDLRNLTSTSELAAYLSQFVAVETLAPRTTTSGTASVRRADRVFNGNGRLLHAYADIADGERLYLVAPGLLFVFPFVRLGHRAVVAAQDSPTGEPVVVESLTESPRTFHLHNFFTDDEADALIARALAIDDDANRLQPSAVVDEHGESRPSPRRTSQNAIDQTSVAAVAIRKRVFDVLALGAYDPAMCDGLQLLRYEQKQAYTAHMDYFEHDPTSAWNWDPATGGSNRFATVFLYLSDVPRGGQTVFPLADMPEGVAASLDHPPDVSEYAARGAELFAPESWEADMVHVCSTKLAAYPRKAHALLFYSQKPNGELDPMSFHGGCPVLDGTKWAANLWVWNRRRPDVVDSKSATFRVTFQNPSGRALDLYWSTTKMATIEPHGHTIYSTFKGHTWTVKDGDRVVLEFVGTPEQGETQTVVVPLDPETKDEL